MFYNPLRLTADPRTGIPAIGGPFTDRAGRLTDDAASWWRRFQTTYQFVADDQTPPTGKAHGHFSVTTLWLGLPGKVFGTFVHRGTSWHTGRDVEARFTETEAEAVTTHAQLLKKYARVRPETLTLSSEWGS